MMPAAIQWRRLDTSGSEAAILEQAEGGWLLTGRAVFLHEAKPCGFSYTIRCAENWRTLSAGISGHVGIDSYDYRIRVEEGSWTINDEVRPRLEGCIDIDLGFSPSTNLLPVRRLQLAAGQSAEVSAAWLRFPHMEFSPLLQKYTRESNNTYRYESPENGFACTIEVNQAGFVTEYPGFWSSESTR